MLSVFNNPCVYLGSGSTGGPTAKPAASVLAQKQNVSCLSKDEAREVGRDLSKVIHKNNAQSRFQILPFSNVGDP
jgi:hypothetical protein